MGYVIEKITEAIDLSGFQCGVPPMDSFIQDGLEQSVENHYCNAYIVRTTEGNAIIAIFALSFDSLDLDIDDKQDMMTGVAVAGTPAMSNDYKDIFLNKPHYPALEITYLAVDERYSRKGIGTILIEAIVKKAQEQELAGCQFLTVEALSTAEYNAVGFYSKCGFSPCEYPDPNKGVLRMYRTLYPITMFEQD